VPRIERRSTKRKLRDSGGARSTSERAPGSARAEGIVVAGSDAPPHATVGRIRRERSHRVTAALNPTIAGGSNRSRERTTERKRRLRRAWGGTRTRAARIVDTA